jgi:hypothetical protein
MEAHDNQETKRLNEAREGTASWRKWGHTYQSVSGVPFAKTTAPMATLGTTLRTIRPALVHIIGAMTELQHLR